MTTLAAVAARAGVGIGSVSRVLNDSPHVSPEMRERVRSAMAEVGYGAERRRRPRPARRPGYVGVLVTYFDEPSALQRLRGIVAHLQPQGFDVVLHNVVSPQQARQRVMELPQHETLDGLIVVSLPLSRLDGERLAAAPFPTVLVDTTARGLSSVNIDDRSGGIMATRHLLDLGHRRIAFVGEPPNHVFGFVASASREDGYRRALLAAGIEPTAELVRHGAHLRSAAKQLTLDLLSLDVPPTAVVAASDVQALGVIEAVVATGRRVPDDVSVVGYDDIELASLMGLTTIRQPLDRSGQRAADLVLEAMAATERTPPIAEELEIELVVRTTTGPRR
jgi:LacI family transcriptional regulator